MKAKTVSATNAQSLDRFDGVEIESTATAKPQTGVDPAELKADPPPIKLPTDFDPIELRIDQSYDHELVTPQLVTIPVGKPEREWFFRVNTDPDMKQMVIVLEYEREIYIVHPKLLPALSGEVPLQNKTLRLCVNRQGMFFVWPVHRPVDDRRVLGWQSSAMAAARLGEAKWVRMQSDMQLQAYKVVIAEADLPEPKWPEATWREILNIAFKDRIITSLDHDVLQKLGGKI